MSRSANQPVCVGASSAARPGRVHMNARPAEPSRYLRTPAARTSTPSSPTSSGYVPIAWYASSTHERAALVRDLRDLLDRRAASRCGSRRRRSRRPPSARRSPPRSARPGSPAPSARTRTTSAPRSSCACQIWPIVGNSKSLITTRGRSAEVDAAREGAHAGRERRRDRDVVGRAADEPRERAACRLGALDPVVPRRAALVPARQVVVVCGAHRVGERALRARVDVRQPLEDREAMAAACGQRVGANGQGTPF